METADRELQGVPASASASAPSSSTAADVPSPSSTASRGESMSSADFALSYVADVLSCLGRPVLVASSPVGMIVQCDREAKRCGMCVAMAAYGLDVRAKHVSAHEPPSVHWTVEVASSQRVARLDVWLPGAWTSSAVVREPAIALHVAASTDVCAGCVAAQPDDGRSSAALSRGSMGPGRTRSHSVPQRSAPPLSIPAQG